MSNKATLIVFSGDLDKVFAAFNIAVGAASAGMDVSIFFTFWGLNVIRKKGSKPYGNDMMRKALGIMNKGGAGKLKLSRFNMYGLGTGLMKGFMDRLKMPRIEKLLAIAEELGVKFIACNTTMQLMGIDKDSIIPGVKSFAGVAKYVEEANQSNINLFI